jgi:hypothetical protein
MAAPALAQRTDVIRGRVTNDSNRALPGVTVIATMAPDRTVHEAVTGADGRYEIRFENGTGDYLVYAGPFAFRAFRKRVLITTPDRTIAVDIKLTAEATLLAAVRATAPRPRALPDGAYALDPTAASQVVRGVVGMLSPDQMGDLTAMASTIPGFSVTPDGALVAFGLPGQVSTTFNGVTMAGATIPADVRASVTVVTSAYDPAIGGFGAGRINVAMSQGTRVPESFGRLTTDGPPLQATGPLGGQLGQRFTQFQLDGLADGPFGDRDAWYNTAFTARRRTSDAASLLNGDADVLALAGVAPDSVAHLRQIAATQGIPLAMSGIPTGQISQSITFVGRVDHYPDPGRYGKLWENAVSLTTLVTVNQSDAPGAGPTTSPGFGRQARGATGQLIGQWLHLNDAYSSEFTNSLSASRNTADPYLNIPAARVLVASQLGEADLVMSPVSIGGSPLSRTENSAESWESIGTLYFYATSSHKMKIYGRSLIDGVSTTPSVNSAGAFAYNSLDAFAAGQPASFTRTLNNPAESAAAWRGAFAVGDLWQVTPNLQVQSGVRAEADHFFSVPANNPAVGAAFGIPNTHVPNTIHASPRLGFAWTYAPTRNSGSNSSQGIGQIQFPVRGVLSGGIGEFRNEIGAAALLSALSGTGLPGGATQLTCIGSAVPAPDWQSYDRDPSTIPVQCAGGAPSVFTDAAPGVTLFDPSYNLPRSWRGNVRWGSVLGRLHYSVDAAYSYNINQPGLVNLNFTNVPQFTLASEAGRPVFAPPSSIVSATGVVSPSEARVSAALGQVSDRVSDLHSTARQVTVNLVPDIDPGIFSHVIFGLWYTLSDVTSTQRGFDGSTFGSPVALESGRSSFDARHSFIVNTGYELPIGVGASLFWRVTSGLPYTPMVGSDVNGDGLANDRAFVFDPTRAADTAVANGMRSLLGSASSQARRCLIAQLGRPAATNSCEGPWTASMNAALSTHYFHVLDRRLATAQLFISNPLGGLDQLLHGSDHLQGWGAPAIPDATLYTVRGFDPVAKEFLYAVNPRFGSTRPSQTTVRAPFRVTLSVRLEVGAPLQKKEFARFRRMNALKKDSALAPVDTLRSRLADLVGDSYKQLLRNRDSLLLTNEQVAALTAADDRYRPRADSVWSALAKYIADTGDSPDLGEVTRRMDAARDRGWAVQREELPHMMAVLSPAQQELAKIMLKPLIESKDHPPPAYHIF